MVSNNTIPLNQCIYQISNHPLIYNTHDVVLFFFIKKTSINPFGVYFYYSVLVFNYLPIDNFVCFFFVSGSMGSGRFQWRRRCCERKRRRKQVAFMAAATSQDTFLCSMQSPRGFPQEWMQYVLLGLCEWSPLLCMSRFPQRTQNNSGTIFNRKKKKGIVLWCSIFYHSIWSNSAGIWIQTVKNQGFGCV